MPERYTAEQREFSPRACLYVRRTIGDAAIHFNRSDFSVSVLDDYEIEGGH